MQRPTFLFYWCVLSLCLLPAVEPLETYFHVPQLLTSSILFGGWVLCLTVYGVHTWRQAARDKQELEERYQEKMNRHVPERHVPERRVPEGQDSKR